ncbi:glycosyltransferase family 4 protein, partial [candidate division KSB1 bacterium]|nr:glycosyltransferase family 4 protein [candidate division KSB1 bacterium]
TWIKQELAILEQEKPDLVISRLTSYGYSPRVVARKTGIPFLIEADCPASYEKIVFQKFFRSTKWLLYWMEKEFLAAGKAAFTVSNQIKQYFDRYRFPSDFMQVIPNGADPDRFNPSISGAAVKQKYDLEGYTVIGFVGSFIYWHGIENLVNLVEATLASDPKVKFLMVGEGGPMKPMLEKFIRERKLEPRAILTGFVAHDEIPQYISVMDIVLAPYPKLDFFYYSPVKIYEYMCCGKPVVTTRIGQIAEIIQDHENGILNEPDRLETFKSSILELVKQPELRHRIGTAARQTVLEHYTWRHRGEQLSRLCEKCTH